MVSSKVAGINSVGSVKVVLNLDMLGSLVTYNTTLFLCYDKN